MAVSGVEHVNFFTKEGTGRVGWASAHAVAKPTPTLLFMSSKMLYLDVALLKTPNTMSFFHENVMSSADVAACFYGSLSPCRLSSIRTVGRPFEAGCSLGSDGIGAAP